MFIVKVFFKSPTNFNFIDCNILLSLGLVPYPVSSSPYRYPIAVVSPTSCGFQDNPGFSVYGFMLRCLIHVELNFVQGNKYGSLWTHLCAAVPFDQQHLLKMLSFLQCASLSKFRPIVVWVYV